MFHFTDTNNGFVEVQFDGVSSKIVCTFIDSQESPNLPTFCTIDYAQEGSTDVVTKTSQSEGQAAEDGRRIEINLPGLGQSTTYTFVVTATNGNTTVNVEGSFTTSGKLLVVLIEHLTALLQLNSITI